MSIELNGEQSKIKKDVPEAMFLHCYVLKLNLVLLHSAKCMPKCKAFFKTLEGLSAFFSKSTKCTHLLDDVVKSKLSDRLSTLCQAIKRIKKFQNLLITRSSQSIVFESKRRSLFFTESLQDGRGRKNVVDQ